MLRYFTLFVFINICQTVGAQVLRYQTCMNCSNTTIPNGSESIPPSGFIYSATIQQMQSNDIVSDFGIRRSGNISPWHIGIDVSSQAGDGDLGDRIYPIENGTIISLDGTGYKYIVIRGTRRYGYGHLFFNGIPPAGGMRSGDFILKTMDPPYASTYAIIYAPNGGTPIAYSTRSSGTVTHPSLNNGAPITVTNQVTTTVPIAPIGDSNTGDAHIHLYNFQNDPVPADVDSNYPSGYNSTELRNPKNALEFLTHANATFQFSFPSVNIVYPGTNRSSFQVRPAIIGENGGNYQNAVYDIDQVELLVKPSLEAGTNFKLIKGRVLDSKIAYGGRLNTDRYPSLNFPPHNTGANAIDIAKGIIGTVDNGIGSVNRTGIHPYAYSTQPYDDFFFSDFYSRIHKNDNYGGTNALIAQKNEDARYPDGQYDYYARVTNVNGVASQSATQTFSIDNFKPYISEVSIYRNSGSGQLLYRGHWDPVGNNLIRNLEPKDNAGTSDNIFIKVKASESLQNLNINIPNVDGTTYRALTPVPNTSNTEFTITYSPILTPATNGINLRGTDFGGNNLEQMQSTPFVVPVRATSTTWSGSTNPGTDSNHYINTGAPVCTNNEGGRIKSNSNARTSGQCLFVDFGASVTQATPGSPIVFSNLTMGSGIVSYQWNFGAGATPATASAIGPHTVTYSSAGTKTVTLVVTDGIGSVTSTKSNYISVSSIPSADVADFSGYPASGTSPLTVNFSGSSTGAVSGWSWNFPGGTPSTSSSQNPVVVYNTSGNYDVTMTINGTTTIYKNSYVTVTSAPSMTAAISYCDNYDFIGCASSYPQYSGIYFTSDISGGSPWYTYSWNFGDGNTSTSAEPLYSYSNSGTFTVTLTVTDIKGATVQTSSSITIAGINPAINTDFIISDDNITAGEGPVVFTDATTGNIDMSLATYYWDFGEGSYPRYAYTKGPHTVCYDDWVKNKTAFLRVHDPVKYITGDKYRNLYVAVSNAAQCISTSSHWQTATGAAAGAAIQSCLWPGQNIGIPNGGLENLTCDLTDSSIRDCVFSTTTPCFSGTWFSSHGTVSMVPFNTNAFRLYASAAYNATYNTYDDSSEGLYYQHSENFKTGKRYVFTFSAAVSNYGSDVFRIIDHLNIFLASGLTPNTNCVNTGSNYNIPTYSFSMHQLGSFDYAINSTGFGCYEVYFYVPNNNFNQIWIYPQAEGSLVNKTFSNNRNQWVLLDNFSLRVGDTADCAPDLVVTNSAPGTLQSGITIKTQGTLSIPNGQVTTYRAGESVTLKPGFNALIGSTFKAQIGQCGTVGARTTEFGEVPAFDDYNLFSSDYKRPISSDFLAEPDFTEQNNKESSFSLVPNPAKEKITAIATLKTASNIEISLVNLLGITIEKRILSGTDEINEEFNLTKLSQGVYLIVVKSGEGIHVMKFVKE